ncbi:uncharacterized protein LOC131601756 isoform X10 [Vicia villosa]|uniref:uncharacterized protein LOC131601756 isoform X10 n=1 Tax=Vicia villosa TaxID=3911 RepID=UPI00273BB547|nr:uncharacterized protein LOC131601756 isoform X10 [Vicia villosa]
MRSETKAHIRILKDDHMPLCALRSDDLVQISGDTAVVKKALHQIASRLHLNPSRTQHLLAFFVPGGYQSGGSLLGPTAGPPIVGITPLAGSYGDIKVTLVTGRSLCTRLPGMKFHPWSLQFVWFAQLETLGA